MILSKFCDIYSKWISRLMVTLGMALLSAVALQVAGRYVPFIPLWLWPEEIVRVSFIWIIFLGSIVALREKEHFTVDIFPMVFKDKKMPRVYFCLDVLYYVISFLIAAVFTFYGFIFFKDWGMIQYSDITGINLGYQYFAVPLAGISWFIFLTDSLLRDIRGKGQSDSKEAQQ